MARTLLALPGAAPGEVASFCQAVLETIEAGICVTDKDLRFVLVNPAACRTYGRPRGALIGQPFTIVLDPANREAAAAAHRAFLDGEGDMSGEFAIRRPDGSRAVVVASVSRLVTAAGEKLRVATTIDITRSRETERALAEAMRTKARFLSAMNHEFRTPLSAILGFGDLLLGAVAQGDIPPRHEAMIREIRGAGEHLMDLVQETLDHARLADGLYVPARRWTGMAALMSEAVRLARFTLEEAGLTLRVEGGPDAPLHVDPPAIRQAVLNMLRVAAQRGRPGCELTLRWRLDGAAVVLEQACSHSPAVVPLHRRSGPQGVAPEFGVEIAAGIFAAHGGELEVVGGGDSGQHMVARLPLPIGIPG